MNKNKIRVLPTSSVSEIIDELILDRNLIKQIVVLTYDDEGNLEVFKTPGRTRELLGDLEILKQQVMGEIVCPDCGSARVSTPEEEDPHAS